MIEVAEGPATPKETKIEPYRLVVGNHTLVINPQERRVTSDGESVHVTGTESKLLKGISGENGLVAEKAHLMWGLYGGVDEAKLKIIDVLVCKLRKKLAIAFPHSPIIFRMWGRGYFVEETDKFGTPVERKPIPFPQGRVAYVLGQGSDVVTRDDLLRPHNDRVRWVVRRKIEVCSAISGGLIDLEAATKGYRLSEREYRSWERLISRHGRAGLRSTRLQFYN